MRYTYPTLSLIQNHKQTVLRTPHIWHVYVPVESSLSKYFWWSFLSFLVLKLSCVAFFSNSLYSYFFALFLNICHESSRTFSRKILRNTRKEWWCGQQIKYLNRENFMYKAVWKSIIIGYENRFWAIFIEICSTIFVLIRMSKHFLYS